MIEITHGFEDMGDKGIKVSVVNTQKVEYGYEPITYTPHISRRLITRCIEKRIIINGKDLYSKETM